MVSLGGRRGKGGWTPFPGQKSKAENKQVRCAAPPSRPKEEDNQDLQENERKCVCVVGTKEAAKHWISNDRSISSLFSSGLLSLASDFPPNLLCLSLSLQRFSKSGKKRGRGEGTRGSYFFFSSVAILRVRLLVQANQGKQGTSQPGKRTEAKIGPWGIARGRGVGNKEEEKDLGRGSNRPVGSRRIRFRPSWAKQASVGRREEETQRQAKTQQQASRKSQSQSQSQQQSRQASKQAMDSGGGGGGGGGG